MKGFQVKIKTDDIDFEIRIQELEEREQDFVREIMRMIDRKVTTPKEEAKINILKDDYKNALIGYNTLANDISGLHRGVDEYIAKSVEEQFAMESADSEEPNNDSSEEEKSEDDVADDEEVFVTKTNIGPELTVNPSIRKNHNEEMLYQTFYICTNCSNKGKRYLPRQAIYITCHNCQHKMRTKPATTKGFPNADSFGNIFVAGNFERVEDRTQESKEIDIKS